MRTPSRFRSPHRALRHTTRGAALLLAMVILALVATTVAGMVWQQSRAVAVESAERARSQAAWILQGALDWARLILREDLRSGQRTGNAYDALGEPWAQPLAEARLSTFLAADQSNNADGGPEAFISGAIEDAQSRFNLRNLVDDSGRPVEIQKAGFLRLCDAAAVAAERCEALVQALSASQAAATPAGVAAAAAAGPNAGTTPLRPQRFADLAWIGVDADTLARLAPHADLLPTPTPVNINTASREAILAAIDGIDPGTAERLVQARQRQPFQTPQAVTGQLPPGTTLDPNRASVGSQHFIVRGRLRLEERVLEERSLLVRRDNRVDVLRREKESFSSGGSPLGALR